MCSLLKYVERQGINDHEVKFQVEFRTYAELHRGLDNGASVSLGDTSLYIDYVFLDTDERRRFAQTQHEYLIEQLQFQGEESLSGLSNKVKLNFNHPVKELVWVVRRDDNGDSSNNEYLHWSNFTTKHTDDDGENPTAQAKLQLNGHDRFSERDGRYFRLVQPYQHHTNTPAEGINVYSFANNPEDHQPSGSVNMSRIDNAHLQLTLASAMSGVASKIQVYAVNVNVLRIMSGMGGIAYAN